MTLSFVVAELLGSAEHTACCGSSAMQQQLTQHGTLPRRLLQLLLALAPPPAVGGSRRPPGTCIFLFDALFGRGGSSSLQPEQQARDSADSGSNSISTGPRRNRPWQGVSLSIGRCQFPSLGLRRKGVPTPGPRLL